MNDLWLISTEDLAKELCSRADNIVLWYRKANETTWGVLKGDLAELDAVGAAVVRAVSEMDDFSANDCSQLNGSDYLLKHLEAGE